MRVLVACEFSGTVRRAFAARVHVIAPPAKVTELKPAHIVAESIAQAIRPNKFDGRHRQGILEWAMRTARSLYPPPRVSRKEQQW